MLTSSSDNTPRNWYIGQVVPADPPSPPMPPAVAGDPVWYAVQTIPRGELDADVELKRLGIYTFYPHHRTKERVGPRRQLREIIRPHFPGYLFAGLLPGQAVGRVNSAGGVAGVVTFGGEPLQIPYPVMDRLFALTDGEGAVPAAPPRRNFAGDVGNQVRLHDQSPFFGLVTRIASIAHLDKSGEIMVWLRMLGVEKAVAVSVEHVAEILP